MKKPFSLMLCLAALLCLLSGCAADRQAERSLSQTRERMLAAAELPEMRSVNAQSDDAQRKLSTITDVDYDKVMDFFIDYAADGAGYEISVIELKDKNDCSAVAESLETHKSRRIEQYRFYAPDQVPRAEKARVSVKGRRVAFVMCDDVEAVMKEF